ncbi:MAG: cyclic nucleotide-binding domain-containing protein [Candidatus Electrothrix aestuarii]|uniref:Cyclic nucleotide-binding domain-containing protein n=1 Tax=Candidatus Electrothrix aestuarii TaxID=3062594 RepID=A0AAU8M0R2_9BACT|nr:cyclic nucleotide-binding domain-containing protein [Candidatus Electrothrix aestuarii]
MNKYCVITTDEMLFETISVSIASSDIQQCLALSNITCFSEAVEYINTELPDVVLINFSDNTMNSFALLDMMIKDQWLLNTGIIAISNCSNDTKKLEELRCANIIVVIEERLIVSALPKILSIVLKNRRILFQRGLGMGIMENISGSFWLENDPLEVTSYANLIANFLFNAKKIDSKGKFDLQLALTEMFMNAVEHGNCAIGFEDKKQWIESGGNMGELILQRNQQPDILKKRVRFEYTLKPMEGYFSITDQGEGFDWPGIMERIEQQGLLSLNGRGILLAQSVTRDLTYNEKGNAVTFKFFYNEEMAELVPALFKNIEPRKVDQGDIVFQQGESSSSLYYIVNGSYDIIVNGKIVSCLNSDDIFMGEMSFLLNNRRSATVRAKVKGQLIKISKKEFVRAIKEKPHYALFLTRLLAQRIHRGNHFERMD